MSRDVCTECGEYFGADELTPVGFGDDGGTVFTIYICAGCIRSSEIDQYWQEAVTAEDREPEKRNP